MEERAGEVLAFNVAAAPADGLQARKKLERALLEWFQGERCRRFVLFGPGGAGKSTLAVKFAAAQVEGGGDGGLRLVFVLSASSMEPDYAGLLGKCPRLAPQCAPAADFPE
jgi:Mrp family chromosome partitioning ATPase